MEYAKRRLKVISAAVVGVHHPQRCPKVKRAHGNTGAREQGSPIESVCRGDVENGAKSDYLSASGGRSAVATGHALFLNRGLP